MLNFIRSDLAKLAAYTPNPGGEVSTSIDRLDANENPLDLPQELQEKLIWIYANELESNRYPDGSHSTLKEAIATYVNESANLDRQITPVNISVGNGSDELIRSLLIATCLQGEGSILVANPTFSMYAILAETLGIKTISVDRLIVDFQIDLVAAQQAIEETKNPPIRVVFVVHPNSPTGNNLNATELDWLRSLDEEILVVIDEAYFEFSRTSVVKELSQRPNWIVLRTFSKAFRLAAYRVGYAIADPELINVLEKVRLPYNLPSFTIAAATVALNNRQLILPYVDKILEERAKLYQALSSISALKTWQSDANFLQVRFQDPHVGDRELANLTQALLEKGTLIRHTGGGLRITVGTPEENNRTIDRLKEIL